MKCLKKLFVWMLVLVCVGVGTLTHVGSISRVEAAKPKLSTTKKTLNQGSSLTLKVNGGKGTIKWSVNNDNVKLNKTSGKKVKVTAVKAGKSKVTAQVKGKKLTCTIKVNGLNIVKKELNVGQQFTLKTSGLGKKIKWSTSKKAVATVKAKGKTAAIVTAKAAGKATITAKVGKKKYKCNVVVSKPAVSTNKVAVNAGASSKITLAGVAAGTEVVWNASNTSLVKVEGTGASATVTVIGKVDKDTTVTVTATVNGETYTWTVEVKHVHTSVKVAGKAATCMEPGLTDGAKCSGCGEILVAQKEIPVAAHKTIHQEAIEPACHYNGQVEHWYCPDCEGFWTDAACTRVTNSKSVILPATGSNNVVHNEAIEPACHYEGQVEYWYCPDCEGFWLDEACTRVTNSKSVILPRTGSENVTHVEAVEPTTTEEGNVEYWYCADCEGFWLDEACTRVTNRLSVILPATGEPEDPVDPEDPVEEAWEIYGDRILFNETNVAYADTTVDGLHNSVSTVYTTDNKVYCKTALAGSPFYGRKFTLNTPITNVTSDMKLRMMVYVVGDETTQADFRLYHIDCTENANVADAYVAQSVTHGTWTEIEIEIAKLVDSDGTFRGFQIGNFDGATDTAYYFNWIELWRVQQETVEPEEPEEEVWEVYGDRILFNETSVAYANTTVDGLHNSVSTVYTTDNKIYCKTALAGSPFYGRTFTLNTPITNVTSDMKLRMMVYVSGDNTTQADFRLYHIDYTENANVADAYIAQSVTHGTWTEIEIEIAKLVDSDGTFRGFQFGSFDGSDDAAYYFNWIELWKVQQETVEPEEPKEVVWEVYGDRIQFNTTNFAYENVNDGIGLHNQASVTQTTADGDAFYCAATENAVTNNWLFFGKKFTLNTPITDVTSDMKLRMRVYVSGDNTTQANFRLYHIDYADNANAEEAYIAPEVTHGVWTEIEIELAKLVDSDGTFRGFQFGNFDAASTMYYFNWIEILKPVQ